MLKRLFAAAALGLALAACGEPAPVETGAERQTRATDASRYTIEILGTDGGALHYIHGGENNRAAALRTEERDPDAARLLEGRAAGQAFQDAIAEFAVPDTEPSDVRFDVFGFSFAADDDSNGEGRVRMEMNLPDGRHFTLNAGDDGSDGGEAHVVIGGSTASEVEDYIDDIDDAPRALREQMKDSLGL